jgi:hypothetical protein
MEESGYGTATKALSWSGEEHCVVIDREDI